MPIFDYTCSCGQTFEKIVSFKDSEKPQKCKCGKEVKRTEITGSTFRLRGNWFKTTGHY